jgi:hypothetical protein
MTRQTFQGRGSLECPTGLFEKAGIAIAFEHVGLNDGPYDMTIAVGNLPLAPTRLSLLAPFEGPQGFPIEVLLPIQRTDPSAFELSVALATELVRDPSQNF